MLSLLYSEELSKVTHPFNMQDDHNSVTALECKLNRLCPIGYFSSRHPKETSVDKLTMTASTCQKIQELSMNLSLRSN
ncbi:hypothetical protein DSO57_1030713 [Entomophthora muscae]|uniref:Uncharacterized protein n=1 Tax=Entomophthora muscae TaxID=34485 RepID=A0ACC2TZM0_9FUNG|nr:hypothetical protein DSO57_1030713 [Entomophthora muscae]